VQHRADLGDARLRRRLQTGDSHRLSCFSPVDGSDTMQLARNSLITIGAIALVIGLVWIGQGLGYFRYPHSSFMIDQSRWAWRGLALAVAGILVIGAARRMARSRD
jgi:hypothetical protein